jgi:hypothetical protein
MAIRRAWKAVSSQADRRNRPNFRRSGEHCANSVAPNHFARRTHSPCQFFQISTEARVLSFVTASESGFALIARTYVFMRLFHPRLECRKGFADLPVHRRSWHVGSMTMRTMKDYSRLEMTEGNPEELIAVLAYGGHFPQERIKRARSLSSPAARRVRGRYDRAPLARRICGQFRSVLRRFCHPIEFSELIRLEQFVLMRWGRWGDFAKRKACVATCNAATM